MVVVRSVRTPAGVAPTMAHRGHLHMARQSNAGDGLVADNHGIRIGAMARAQRLAACALYCHRSDNNGVSPTDSKQFLHCLHVDELARAHTLGTALLVDAVDAGSGSRWTGSGVLFVPAARMMLTSSQATPPPRQIRRCLCRRG